MKSPVLFDAGLTDQGFTPAPDQLILAVGRFPMARECGDRQRGRAMPTVMAWWLSIVNVACGGRRSAHHRRSHRDSSEQIRSADRRSSRELNREPMQGRPRGTAEGSGADARDSRAGLFHHVAGQGDIAEIISFVLRGRAE